MHPHLQGTGCHLKRMSGMAALLSLHEKSRINFRVNAEKVSYI